MGTPRTPRRPRPVQVGPLCASTMKRTQINENGEIEWYWRVRRTGDRGYVWRGYGTREFVEALLPRLVVSGRTEPASRTREASSIGTVGELADLWFGYQLTRADIQPATVSNYEKGARHIIAWLGGDLLALIDRATVEGYRNNRLREKAAPRTVELELKVLRMMWNWGRDRNLAPAKALPLVKVKIEGYVINHYTPTPGEAGAVLAILDGLTLLVIQILAMTGARVHSICAVREEDLNDTRGLSIPDSKTGRRWFPIPSDISSSLREHFRGNSGPLVHGGKRVAPQIVRDRLKRACKAAGVPAFTPHAFRRAVVDKMSRAGVDPATAASLTGHSVEVMLRKYRQVTDEDRRQAVLKAGLGHFPTQGKVVEGPWGGETGAAAAAWGSAPRRGTDPGHNDDK